MSITTVRLQAEVEQHLEAIAGRLHRCQTLFEIWFSANTSFDIHFMPVPSLFSGYGMALKVNDSNVTRRGTGVSISR
ncbi:MAG: hypothetical protein ACTHYN_12945 [Marinobacter sp.]|uniref:hypothetical protein n=1 Tax=Marinobacter sp. TaxID=50741 RepID=UPI003F9C17FF